MIKHTPRFLFRHRDRLHGRRAFAAVFDARLRKSAGPIAVCARCNGLGFCRLGLSVPRGAGSAVVRNRIKRRLREAFRLSRHQWPGAYDLVVVVRRHEPADLETYQRLLTEAVRNIHQTSVKRQAREGEP